MPVQHTGRRLSFGIIAEIHHGEPLAEPVQWHNELRLGDSGALLQSAVDALSAEALDGVVLLGDLTNKADEPSLTQVLDCVSAIDAPLHVVPGNHDIDSHPDAAYRFAAITETFAASVAPSVFEFCPGLSIALLSLQRDRDTGGLSSSGDQESLLPGSAPLVVFTHFPVMPLESRLLAAGLKHAGDLIDRTALHARLIERSGPVIVIHGHLHVRASTASGPLLQLSCAALVEPPHEITIVSIEVCQPGMVRVQRRTRNVEAYAVEHLPVLAPEDESWTWLDGRWLAI